MRWFNPCVMFTFLKPRFKKHHTNLRKTEQIYIYIYAAFSVPDNTENMCKKCEKLFLASSQLTSQLKRWHGIVSLAPSVTPESLHTCFSAQTEDLEFRSHRLQKRGPLSCWRIGDELIYIVIIYLLCPSPAVQMQVSRCVECLVACCRCSHCREVKAQKQGSDNIVTVSSWHLTFCIFFFFL